MKSILGEAILKCNDNDLVKSLKKIIFELETNVDKLPFIPISKKDLQDTKKALDDYLKECTICAQEGANDISCMNQAKVNLIRRVPMFANNIYPWKNFDWDYNNYVRKNYSPEATGASSEASIKAMYSNVKALIKLLNGI